jgi:BirA family biotin operon repressor/biotin-[acetyl-CoA-carboxylase] ligase
MAEDNLSAAAIASHLGTRFVGQRIVYYPSVASTNEAAKQEVERGAAEGTVVVADEQTAGKGRIKRGWLTPKGNIALSIILYPLLDYLPYLIMVASLAVVHGIEAATGIKSEIKWPNDVLIKGRKVCGILIENKVRGDVVNYSVIGIGVNVNLNLDYFPEIRATATSLYDELRKNVSILGLIRRLLVEFEKLYSASPDAVFQEWRDNLVTLGKRVRVKSGETVHEGVAESVDKDGSLLLRSPDGALTKIVAGDVTLRE